MDKRTAELVLAAYGDLDAQLIAADPIGLVGILLARGANDSCARGVADDLLALIPDPGPASLDVAAASLDEERVRRLIVGFDDLGDRGRELCGRLLARTDLGLQV